ncbi:DNA repair protein RecO [Metamycoplasma buccale]|uniref:DNA repair protein RecO n=1 Tax=Metamycoplasma buccale TaxID=55602 RepID=UPI00398EFC1A
MEETWNAIILNKSNFNDFDEIISVLTTNGIKKIFAPGVRKITSKNRNSLTILNLCNLEIILPKNNNLLPRLKRANIINQFPNNPMLLSFANDLKYFFSFIKKSNCKKLLDVYHELLPLLNQNKDTKILDYLLFKILECEGINPKLDGCIECKNTENLIDFQFHKGGFLCTNHSDNYLGKSLLISLYYINKDFSYFDKYTNFVDAQTIKKMIIQYLIENY